MSDGNYRKLRKNKMLKDDVFTQFEDVTNPVKVVSVKTKRMLKITSMLIMVGVISILAFEYSESKMTTHAYPHNNGASNDSAKNKKVPSTSNHLKKSVNSDGINKWNIETPSEILNIEKINKGATVKAITSTTSTIAKKRTGNPILTLYKPATEKQKIPLNHKGVINQQKSKPTIRPIIKKQHTALKMVSKPNYRNNHIVAQKKVVIAPESRIHNNIFVIPPNVRPNSGGWKITEVYKKYAIITNAQGKSYTVHTGSFVDGHEVLRVSKERVYLTGNILINK
jgi:hypothetical protein